MDKHLFNCNFLRVQRQISQQKAKKTMGFNLLDVMQPLTRFVPQVAKPTIPINLKEKTIFTAVALFIYLVCSQIPLYGIIRTYSSDPFYWTRVILASSHGTLMELGIGPIISAGWMLQFVQAMGLIKTNSKQDQKNLDKVQKLFAVIFCFGEAAGQIWYGSYGPPSNLGSTQIALILAQLMGAGVIVMLLDDMLKKGYGLGSGISLFIVVGTSENIFWKLFSPVTFSSEFGVQFEGCVVSLVHFLLTKPNKQQALIQAFTRPNSPNLASLCGTIVIFFIVIYLSGFKMKIPLIHQQHRGYKSQFPIKLFFTSTISVILQSMFISNFYSISQILYSRFNKTVWINLMGVWENGKVIGGFAWYISPPGNVTEFVDHPIRAFTYVTFMCLLCATFSRFWIQITKQTPKQIAKSIRAQGLTLPSYQNQSVISVLNKYIPTAAMLGGIVIGLLTILGDTLNVFGSSTGILLSVTILYGYYEKLTNKGSGDGCC